MAKERILELDPNKIAADLDHDAEVFSVSELLNLTRTIIEDNFPSVWVSGEISNFSCPSSGHWYFSIKDENAQVRCAMFRNANRRLDFEPETGMHVLMRASPSLYSARGDFQLIASHMEDMGAGRLHREYERLKKKLEKQGLFHEKHKQAIPETPNCIGLITSATGAAIQDALSVLERRFPLIPIRLYPAMVQGNAAPAELCHCIRYANHEDKCDVLLLIRGGGSMEDLWCFNDEALAHAIFDSHIPIISGVGHEVDFTIADFIADARAPTPSVAAEMVTPDQEDIETQINHLSIRLGRAMRSELDYFQQEISQLRKRLKHPRHTLREKAQQLDWLEDKLQQLQRAYLQKFTLTLAKQQSRLSNQHPKLLLEKQKQSVLRLNEALKQSMQGAFTKWQAQLSSNARTLNTLSPLNTLDRGYAIIQTPKTQKVVRSTKDVAVGDTIQATVHQGKLTCEVIKKHDS